MFPHFGKKLQEKIKIVYSRFISQKQWGKQLHSINIALCLIN